MKRLLLASVLLLPWLARAESELDLNDLLARPGVRAVAVEFYADWCKPCQEAMPRWRELKRRYGKDGLRIVLVNANDPDDPGKCKKLGWSPDVLICDVDGALDQRFGVNGKLPSAFLWSWQRNLLVRSGDIGEVEGAVEQLFKELPRVVIETEGEVSSGVADEVADALAYDGKVQVVANETERRKLLDQQLEQHRDAATDADSRCELGRMLAPNMRLVVSLGGQDPSLRLKLQNLATGCVLQQVKAGWDQKSSSNSARDATANLVSALRGPLEWPTVIGSTQRPPGQSKRRVTEGRLGTADDFDLGEAAEVVASFDSVPAGAVVLVDGKVVCKATPCTKTVVVGRHEVTMSLEQYDDASASLDLSTKTKRVKLELAPAFGLLDVATTPSGVSVSVDGKEVGTTPLTGLRLDPGGHEVLVNDRCWQELGERVAIEKGRTRRVTIDAWPRYAGLSLSAADNLGNDLEAEVEVDGEAKGTTPLSVKVSICAKEVTMRTSDGRVRRKSLELNASEVLPIHLTFGPSGVPVRRTPEASDGHASSDSYSLGIGLGYEYMRANFESGDSPVDGTAAKIHWPGGTQTNGIRMEMSIGAMVAAFSVATSGLKYMIGGRYSLFSSDAGGVFLDALGGGIMLSLNHAAPNIYNDYRPMKILGNSVVMGENITVSGTMYAAEFGAGGVIRLSSLTNVTVRVSMPFATTPSWHDPSQNSLAEGLVPSASVTGPVINAMLNWNLQELIKRQAN